MGKSRLSGREVERMGKKQWWGSGEMEPFNQANLTKERWGFASKPFPWEMSHLPNPGSNNPEPYFDNHELSLPGILQANATPGAEALAREKETDQFHNSESEDIYDLYNACNGVVRNGFLDIRKLDELSPEELEVLNLARLREIWAHTTYGCIKCAEIVRTLNTVRGRLREDEFQKKALER
jgi:hypothetical protein